MHHTTIGKSQAHMTPRLILDALGSFDLDPCAADPRPWDCATTNFARADNGLHRVWCGRVWLNPPFDRRVIGAWIDRLAEHGRGTALVHARLDTQWFETVWERATSMLFLADRVKFCRSDGSTQKKDSGAPVVLVAFGSSDAEVLSHAGLRGFLVTSWRKNRVARLDSQIDQLSLLMMAVEPCPPPRGLSR